MKEVAQTREKERREELKRAGYSLMEIMLVLGIIASLLGGIFVIYRKVKTSTEISNAVNTVKSVISVVENVRGNNGNVYPAVDADLTSPPFAYYLGDNKADVVGATYSCPAGADTTITITFPTSLTPTAEICQAVANDIMTSTPWQADCGGGNQLAITKTPVICQ